MTTTVPAARVNSLRAKAAEARQPPEDVPEGWSKSLVDPAAVVAASVGVLHVKPVYRLVAYQFSAGDNGNGIVWAISAKATFPEPADCNRIRGFLDPPKPPGALADFMEAIDGDGSPWSYLCASVLKRELEEFGALWHGCSWEEHAILDGDPWKTRPRMISSPAKAWTWIEAKPAIWKPHVVMEADAVTVSFITYSALGAEALDLHKDIYTRGSYCMHTQRVQLATGGPGFVH